jgi:ribonuclease HII
MGWVCGIEEAGRGPVIGPMVMACLWAEDEELLRKVGARDSKQLSPQQRETVFENLEALRDKGIIGFESVLLSPVEIDAAVEGESDNLNKLEQRTSARLIGLAMEAASKRSIRIEKVLIDCPTVSTQKYADGIRKLLKNVAEENDLTSANEIEIVAENKADENYVVVGAASVVAKVTRDREIGNIKKRIGVEFGSGYPADPSTQKFLRENYAKKEYDGIFRTSWGSYKTLLAQAKQSSLSQYLETRHANKTGLSKKTGFSKNSSDDKDMKGESGEDQIRNSTNSEDVSELSRMKNGTQHLAELAEFDFLKEHGFEFVAPKSDYEVLRMKGPDATVIKYTTGKVLVQGKGKVRVDKLLKGL